MTPLTILTVLIGEDNQKGAAELQRVVEIFDGCLPDSWPSLLNLSQVIEVPTEFDLHVMQTCRDNNIQLIDICTKNS